MSTQIDLGPVLSIPKGDWNADTIYERLNIVRHNSAAWICNVATSKGVEPTEDSTDWYLQVKDTSSVSSVNGMKGDVVIELTETETPPADDNSNRIATTEWVTDKLGDVDLSGIKEDTVLAVQLASNLEVDKDTFIDETYGEQLEEALRGLVSRPALGQPWFGFHESEVPAGVLLFTATTHSRVLYADFWNYIQNKNLVKTEEEWQSIYNEQGWCPFYSDGDGIDTFRMPSAPLYLHGAGTLSEAGKYIEAGLPDITGNGWNQYGMNAEDWTGAFSAGDITVTAGAASGSSVGQGSLSFDASRSNPIYGNSDTVTPETSKMLFGVWAISAPQQPIPDATVEGIISELSATKNGLNGVVRSVNGKAADAGGNIDISAAPTAGPGISVSGQQVSLATVVTAGNAGPTANATPAFGATFTVPYITYDAYGRVTGNTNRTVKIPAAPSSVTTATKATTTPNTKVVSFKGDSYTFPSGGTWAGLFAIQTGASAGAEVFSGKAGGSKVSFYPATYWVGIIHRTA